MSMVCTYRRSRCVGQTPVPADATPSAPSTAVPGHHWPRAPPSRPAARSGADPATNSARGDRDIAGVSEAKTGLVALASEVHLQGEIRARIVQHLTPDSAASAGSVSSASMAAAIKMTVESAASSSCMTDGPWSQLQSGLPRSPCAARPGRRPRSAGEPTLMWRDRRKQHADEARRTAPASSE